MVEFQDDTAAPLGPESVDLEDEEDPRDLRAALATLVAA